MGLVHSWMSFGLIKYLAPLITREGTRTFNQVNMAKWNILRLAECFLPLIDSNQEKSIEKVEHEIVSLFPHFEHKRMVRLGRKLGIEDYKDEDEKLIMLFLEYLEKESLDFTLAFRNLEALRLEDFTSYPETNELKSLNHSGVKEF